MIARGAMLGPDQPVILHMLDIEPAKQVRVFVRSGAGGGGAWAGAERALLGVERRMI